MSNAFSEKKNIFSQKIDLKRRRKVLLLTHGKRLCYMSNGDYQG